MIIRSVKDLGALIRDRRKELGLSQEELAAQVGVRRLWVGQFEAGKATAHVGLVMRTLRVLNLELRIGEGDRQRVSEGDRASDSTREGNRQGRDSSDSRTVDLNALLEANVGRGGE